MFLCKVQAKNSICQQVMHVSLVVFSCCSTEGYFCMYYSHSQHTLFDGFTKPSIMPLHYVCHRWVKFSPMPTGTVSRVMFRWGANPAGDPSLVLWQSTSWQVTAKGQDECLAPQPKRSGVCILACGLALIKWKTLWSFAFHKGKLERWSNPFSFLLFLLYIFISVSSHSLSVLRKMETAVWQSQSLIILKDRTKASEMGQIPSMSCFILWPV